MKAKENDYLNQESTSWLKILEKLQEENIELKKRFSEYIKRAKDSSFMEKLESFHNNLLNKDTLLSLIRHEIIDLNQLMKSNPSAKNFEKRLSKLRDDMKKLEEEFERLKKDFINYTERLKA